MPVPASLSRLQRLRRKLRFWRILFGGIAALFIVAIISASFFGDMKKGRDHIAKVEISGAITNDRPLIEMIEKLRKNDKVKAVVLDISSPGGTTVGGEAIYNAVRELAAEKPVATSVGTLAASAGYMIACGSDHIVAYRSSIVGSIGVLVQYGEASGLLDKLGVKVDAVKSSTLKAEPSPFHPVTEEAKAMLGRVVDDTYQRFVDLVAERRKFDMAKARALADGSLFTGAQGLANGLIDAIGDIDTAKQWLVSEKGISDKLELVEWKPEREDTGATSLLRRTLSAFVPSLLEKEASTLAETVQRLVFVDGLQSVMQIGTPATMK